MSWTGVDILRSCAAISATLRLRLEVDGKVHFLDEVPLGSSTNRVVCTLTSVNWSVPLECVTI